MSDSLGSSTAQEDIIEDLLCLGISKTKLRDAVVYYEQMLTESGLIEEKPSAIISEESILLAEDLFQYTLQMLQEKKFVTEDELVLFDEVQKDNDFETPVFEDSSQDNESEEKKSKPYTDYISLDYKRNVINIARKHPQWKLNTLQRQGCSRLKRMEDLPKWEKHVISGGTVIDKYAAIDSWTYDRFEEARKNHQQVTTRNLQKWALSAASQYEDLYFKASGKLINNFKRKHRIGQRKITKLVSEREIISVHEILIAAEDFRIQARDLIPNFDPDFVINTDQTGMLDFYYC